MSDKVPNFIDFQVGKAVPSKEHSVAVAQDQDTAIGDAMCHAAQILYDVAVKIAHCISNNAQYAIDLKDLHRAELALSYMQGVRFGLAMDDERDIAYLAYMERTMSSIRRSKESGFQLQIDVPPRPSEFLHYDEMHCRAMGDMFLHSLNDTPPSNERIRELEDRIQEEGHGGPTPLPSMHGGDRGAVLVISDEPANVEDAAIKDVDIGEVLSDVIKPLKVDLSKVTITPIKDKWNVLFGIDKDKYPMIDRGDVARKIRAGFADRGYDVSLGYLKQSFPPQYILTISVRDLVVEDAVPEVNRLRMLLRTNRIGKEAFCGGIATLMATGIISKSEFTRLSTLAK